MVSSSSNFHSKFHNNYICDCPPGQQQLVTTVEHMCCRNCGIVISPVYEDTMKFEAVSEFSQPEFNDSKQAIDAITDLVNWHGADISLEVKNSMIVSTSMLAMKLKQHKITYPSQYFLAAAIVFSRQFERDDKKALQQLSTRYTKTCEQMLKKAKKIIQYKVKLDQKRSDCTNINTNNELNNKQTKQDKTDNNGIIQPIVENGQHITKLNHYMPNMINNYYSKKIQIIDNINERDSTRSLSQITEDLKFSRMTYYRTKKRLQGNFKRITRYPKRKITPEIGKLILDNKDNTIEEIRSIIAQTTRWWYGSQGMVILDGSTISRYLNN